MLWSRLWYYLSSIPTLLSGIANWPGIVVALLRRSGQPFVVRLRNGARFLARTPMDIWVLKEAYLDRQYERASVEIQDGWTIVDIGAGVGDFAIAVAREHPNCRVYAFEPLAGSFALLEENLGLNQVTNVQAFPFAIGGLSGRTELRAVSAEPVQYTITGARIREDASSLQVRAMSLDQMFEELNLTRCDYIKVDCEGAEFQIFFGATPATLARINHICLEYHDGVVQSSHEDLTRLFEKNGFTVTTIPNPVHRHLGLMYARSNA